MTRGAWRHSLLERGFNLVSEVPRNSIGAKGKESELPRSSTRINGITGAPRKAIGGDPRIFDRVRVEGSDALMGARPVFIVSRMQGEPRDFRYQQRVLLGIEGLWPGHFLDVADRYVNLSREGELPQSLRGRAVISCFFEDSECTRASFEGAASGSVPASLTWRISARAMRNGETLIVTVTTLNAMHPDVLVARHLELSGVNRATKQSRSTRAVLP